MRLDEGSNKERGFERGFERDGLRERSRERKCFTERTAEGLPLQSKRS